MSLPLCVSRRGRPRLMVVRGTRAPLSGDPACDWRRLAQAVIACTHELATHLVEHRWGRVDEALRERRELLAGLARLPLDGEGRSCLRSLSEAATESESAIAAMMGARRDHQ
jgi:NurA-like 5'-3' nuclease